jgi:hypothetical protein
MVTTVLGKRGYAARISADFEAGVPDRPLDRSIPAKKKPSAIVRLTRSRASFARADSLVALGIDQAGAASDDG